MSWAPSEGLDALGLTGPVWKLLAQPAGRRPSRWTGAARAPPAVDRKPEADYPSFRHVHVTYVIPADAPSRMEELASKIVTDPAAADAWWQREDPSRTIRFDPPRSRCSTKLGSSISAFSVGGAAAAYEGDLGSWA